MTQPAVLIYGNWEVYSPDDVLMFRTTDKRANWYLSRDLAEQIKPNAIKLKFVPNGLGNSDEPAMIEEKHNHCVVCGSTHELNRHHVVPYQYRKHFPLEMKARTSHDIVPLCLDDHEKYEIVAQQFSKELAITYGVVAPFANEPLAAEDLTLVRAIKSAHALLTVGDVIPEEKKLMLLQHVQVVSQDLTPEGLKAVVESKSSLNISRTKNHAEKLVKAVLEKDGLHEFNRAWRQHFIDTMRPKFLSPNWSVDYMTKTNRRP